MLPDAAIDWREAAFAPKPRLDMTQWPSRLSGKMKNWIDTRKVVPEACDSVAQLSTVRGV